MVTYFDERNGLLMPSWDLWEERWGVHAFTVGSVWGGLDAARNFADLFGDVASYVRYRDAAERLREASDTHLYSAELGRFPRRIAVEDDESVTVDTVLDSAIYGLWRFGMYPPDDSRIVDTMKAIATQLANGAEGGGIARYTDDYYFKVESDTRKVPGNPWFMCTMWLAQWYVATAKTAADLQPARDIIDWVVGHQMPGGLLSEQLDPNTGAPLSVSPLTWSHAEFIVTVDDYCKKALALRRKPSSQSTKWGCRPALLRPSPASELPNAVKHPLQRRGLRGGGLLPPRLREGCCRACVEGARRSYTNRAAGREPIRAWSGWARLRRRRSRAPL